MQFLIVYCPSKYHVALEFWTKPYVYVNVRFILFVTFKKRKAKVFETDRRIIFRCNIRYNDPGITMLNITELSYAGNQQQEITLKDAQERSLL